MPHPPDSAASPLFLRVALATPLRRFFDYLAPAHFTPLMLQPGVRVLVPFQSRELVGIVIEILPQSEVPAHKLKQALAILDEQPILAPDIQALCTWAAQYYHYPLGEVMLAALPTLLRKNGKQAIDHPPPPLEPSLDSPLLPRLNAAQEQAVAHIIAAKNSFKVCLLDGVTSSGKTEVYLRTMANILQEGGRILVLIPEISLTPQTLSRFAARFHVNIVSIHSHLAASKRLQAWRLAASGTAQIIIGTRSAIFTPIPNLKLIIVDEEHDASFKQHERFRYHARDLAIIRAKINQIPIVLGSATPSLESQWNVTHQRYDYLSLPYRAGEAVLPTYRVIDITALPKNTALSLELTQAMQEHLTRGNQVMLFLNRRGFAPIVYCPNCMHIASCKNCSARMVYHRVGEQLRCHHCDSKRPVPRQCEHCQHSQLETIGMGTQRLSQQLSETFPGIPIIRVDHDNTRRKNALKNLLEEIHRTPSAILLGTQMLAKGHHFKHLTLVGLIDADSSLFSIDFRAAEHMGQLITQVAGRAGREHLQGEVFIQTRFPQHPLLHTLIDKGYAEFSTTLLQEREAALLPPYSYCAVFRAASSQATQAESFLKMIKKMLGDKHAVELLGPVAAQLSKKKGLYYFNLLLKAHHRSAIQQLLTSTLPAIEAIKTSSRLKWILEVDPLSI